MKPHFTHIARAAFATLLSSTLLVAAAHAADPLPVVDMYKSPYCGCCGKWADHMKAAGFTIRTHETDDVPAARAKLGMPDQYGSCHTAKVGDYVVEGHVPPADIKRLLQEKPKAVGLAAPGMPLGSPGMEGPTKEPFATLLVSRDGKSSVFAQH